MKMCLNVAVDVRGVQNSVLPFFPPISPGCSKPDSNDQDRSNAVSELAGWAYDLNQVCRSRERWGGKRARAAVLQAPELDMPGCMLNKKADVGKSSSFFLQQDHDERSTIARACVARSWKPLLCYEWVSSPRALPSGMRAHLFFFFFPPKRFLGRFVGTTSPAVRRQFWRNASSASPKRTREPPHTKHTHTHTLASFLGLSMFTWEVL